MTLLSFCLSSLELLTLQKRCWLQWYQQASLSGDPQSLESCGKAGRSKAQSVSVSVSVKRQGPEASRGRETEYGVRWAV